MTPPNPMRNLLAPPPQIQYGICIPPPPPNTFQMNTPLYVALAMLLYL